MIQPGNSLKTKHGAKNEPKPRFTTRPNLWLEFGNPAFGDYPYVTRSVTPNREAMELSQGEATLHL
jgi:hypothetical protein